MTLNKTIENILEEFDKEFPTDEWSKPFVSYAGMNPAKIKAFISQSITKAVKEFAWHSDKVNECLEKIIQKENERKRTSKSIYRRNYQKDTRNCVR